MKRRRNPTFILRSFPTVAMATNCGPCHGQALKSRNPTFIGRSFPTLRQLTNVPQLLERLQSQSHLHRQVVSDQMEIVTDTSRTCPRSQSHLHRQVVSDKYNGSIPTALMIEKSQSHLHRQVVSDSKQPDISGQEGMQRVAIPPYCSGRFRRFVTELWNKELRAVAIPPSSSGRFRRGEPGSHGYGASNVAIPQYCSGASDSTPQDHQGRRGGGTPKGFRRVARGQAPKVRRPRVAENINIPSPGRGDGSSEGWAFCRRPSGALLIDGVSRSRGLRTFGA